MTAADKIAEARALIEPLTERRTFTFAGLFTALEQTRDTVAALADLADAQAQENARLRSALQWYASDEAWTMRQLESGHGDYGKRARAALGDAP